MARERLSSESLRLRLARLAFDCGGLIVLAALVLYVWVAPSHVVDGDNAEFATLGAVGGVAHPPGYPLYVLYLRALSWLPGSPAHAAAIATVLIVAAQLFVLHAACRAWGARPLAATIAVAIYAAGPVAMRVQTEAEVFALNGLIIALVLWLSAARGPVTGGYRAALLGLVAGLGLANHTTCVLVAPIGILGVVRAAREAKPAPAIGLAVGGLVAGLLPYLYLFAAPATRLSWTQIESVGDLVHHVLRYDFGGPSAFARSGGEPETGANLLALAATLARGWLWLPLAIGLGALGAHVAKRRETSESRLAWAMLALAFVIAGPLLALRFNLPPRGLTLHICQRFHLVALLLLAVPVAVGLDWLGTTIAARARVPARIATTGSALATITFIALAATSLPHLAASHSPAVEQGVRNMLHSVPDGAVVIVTSDEGYFGSAYVQDALGERTDVVVIGWTLMSLDDYRARVAARLGIDLRHGSSVALTEQALARGRAVFVDGLMSSVVRELPTYPHGVLFRVLPRGTPRPPIDEVFAINKQLFEKFQFGYPIPTADPTLYPTYVHSEYARTWAIIADALAAAGKRDEQAYAIDMARALGPQAP